MTIFVKRGSAYVGIVKKADNVQSRLNTHMRNGWTVVAVYKVSNMRRWEDQQMAARDNVNCISSAAPASPGYGYRLVCKRKRCYLNRDRICRNGCIARW